MKKLLSLMLVVVVAGLFAGCGDDGDKDCTPSCTDAACGDSDGCGGQCSGTCPDGETCNASFECEAEGDCCPGQTLHITVTGASVDLATQQGAQADLAALAPLTALSGDIATHEAEASSDATGAFMFDCFDVSGVSLGLILLADDPGFDGAAGSYYPTVSGIAGYTDNNDKVCEEGATAMMINNQLLGGLQAALADLDVDNVGMIIGNVLDAERNPIAGATVARSDGNALTVIYPNADFTDLSGTSTSATGIYMVIDQLSLTALIGVADGYSWDPTTFKAATIAGAIYYVPLVADAQ